MDGPDGPYRYGGTAYTCSTSLAMGLIGGKWKSVLLYHLLDGERRFSELRRLARPISERTLSLQLKQLEADGLVSRHVYVERAPMRVSYRLTARGETARAAVLAIAAWGRAVAEG